MSRYAAAGKRLMGGVYGPRSRAAKTFGNYAHTPQDPVYGYKHGLKSMIDALYVAIDELEAGTCAGNDDGQLGYSVQQVLEQRDIFMSGLYELASGGLSIDWPHQDDVSRHVGIHPDLGALVAQRLKDDGLLSFETFGPALSLTQAGRERVERLSQQAKAPAHGRYPLWRRAGGWLRDTIMGRSGFIQAIAFWVLLVAGAVTIWWIVSQ